MKNFIILLAVIFSLSSFAAPSAKIEKMRGKVTYNGKAVKEGDVLKIGGDLVVSKRSYAKLFIEDFGSHIALAPNSKMKLVLDQKKKKSKYSLLKGKVRWKTQKVSKAKQKGFIETKNAVFGIRGTDFMVVANPVLGESEIICFDGKVQFTSSQEKSDSKTINKNQWGGLGGRFGSNIGDVMTLPISIVEHFKKSLKL